MTKHKKAHHHNAEGSGAADPEDAGKDANSAERSETSAASEAQEPSSASLKQEGKAAEYIEHLQRLQAEFDNFRKRSEKEKQMIRVYVFEEVMTGLLPVLDNFQRALDALKNSENGSSPFFQGVQMIYRQFEEMLKTNGIGPIKSIGEKFDPAVHEAVGTEVSDKEDDMIVKEVLTGYQLNGRVIRPAAVIVSRKKKSDSSEAAPDGADGPTQEE